MQNLTVEEVYLLHHLMDNVENGQGKFSLEEIVESPFFEKAFDKLSESINDFVKSRPRFS